MASTPVSYPVWMQLNGQSVICNDLVSFNYLLTLGATFSSTSTPTYVVGTGVVSTELSISPYQPDPSDVSSNT